MVGRHRGDRVDDRLVGAEDGEEIAVAHDLDRRLRRPPKCGFVDPGYGRAAARLAHDASVNHAVERHVMDENGLAEYLRGQVDARHIPPDDMVVADALGSRPAGGGTCEIDGRGKRPIIMARRLAAMQDGAVAHREFVAGIAETRRGMIEKQRPHLGAGHAQGDATELDRLTARGVTLVRR